MIWSYFASTDWHCIFTHAKDKIPLTIAFYTVFLLQLNTCIGHSWVKIWEVTPSIKASWKILKWFKKVEKVNHKNMKWRVTLSSWNTLSVTSQKSCDFWFSHAIFSISVADSATGEGQEAWNLCNDIWQLSFLRLFLQFLRDGRGRHVFAVFAVMCGELRDSSSVMCDPVTEGSGPGNHLTNWACK